MNATRNTSKDPLLARADDLRERAERGEITYTPFLSPAELHRLGRALPCKDAILQNGGYAAAERARIFFLPPYLAEGDETLREACLAECFAEVLIPLEIVGSGFRTLTYRDYLGAILNLGLERDAIGDLCAPEPHRAITFCDRVIADFLKEHLTRVASDAVRVRECVLPPDFDGGRQFAAITDTVASERTDCIVAALANLSRERASAMLREGLVEVDFEPAERPDKPIAEGSVIVIRGKGKFIIRSLSQQTKKGRLRLVADQYL
jgi:RNA-binding protein YlmH